MMTLSVEVLTEFTHGIKSVMAQAFFWCGSLEAFALKRVVEPSVLTIQQR